VRWAVHPCHVVIRAGSLVLVPHDQCDRGAQRHPLGHTREDLNLISLVALRGQSRLPRSAPIQIGLDVGLGQRQPGWAAVDHDPDRAPVGLTEGGDAKR
jgi:hypothetical protein